MGWFQRRKSPTDVLIEQIIQEGIERRKLDAELAHKQRDFDLRKLEIEMEHLEAIGDERRKDRADKQAARVARQNAAAHAREVVARKALERAAQGGSEVCPVCANDKDPNLTERQITWHYNGHREGPSLWAQ